LAAGIAPSDFVDQYFALWKRDRDAQWEYVNRGNALNPQEQSLCDFLDRIFTACDCYSDRPENPHDISETQLREEIALVAKERWPHDAA
jgi:hypothetical protein